MEFLLIPVVSLYECDCIPWARACRNFEAGQCQSRLDDLALTLLARSFDNTVAQNILPTVQVTTHTIMAQYLYASDS